MKTSRHPILITTDSIFLLVFAYAIAQTLPLRGYTDAGFFYGAIYYIIILLALLLIMANVYIILSEKIIEKSPWKRLSASEVVMLCFIVIFTLIVGFAITGFFIGG